MQEVTKKVAPYEKNQKNTKNLVKLPYSAQKLLLRASEPYTVFCFDLQPCEKLSKVVSV